MAGCPVRSPGWGVTSIFDITLSFYPYACRDSQYECITVAACKPFRLNDPTSSHPQKKLPRIRVCLINTRAYMQPFTHKEVGRDDFFVLIDFEQLVFGDQLSLLNRLRFETTYNQRIRPHYYVQPFSGCNLATPSLYFSFVQENVEEKLIYGLEVYNTVKNI